MKLKIYDHRALCSIALALMIVAFGCGEETGMYQGEDLVFETPTSELNRTNKPAVSKLDLNESNAADFRITRLGAFGAWEPFPLFDYYLEPLPVEVPVAPGVSLVEFVHPFYALPLWDNWGFDSWGWDHWDDDGLPFRRDDD